MYSKALSQDTNVPWTLITFFFGEEFGVIISIFVTHFEWPELLNIYACIYIDIYHLSINIYNFLTREKLYL